MVSIARVSVVAAYLVTSALMFLRPFPATGSDQGSGAGMAILSGPAYKLVVVCQQPYAFGDDGSTTVLYPAVLLIVWTGGLTWLFLLKKNSLHVISFGVFWALVGLWNLVDFGLSSIW